MNRRDFLRSLLGTAAATALAPALPAAVTYVLPPPTGWSLRSAEGLWLSNSAGTASWASRTSEEILADVNMLLSQMAFLPARLEILDSRLLVPLRRRFGYRPR